MSHPMMTQEQKLRKAAYDRERKVINAEKRKRKAAELKVIEEQMKGVFTKEQNIEHTKTWWGKP